MTGNTTTTARRGRPTNAESGRDVPITQAERSRRWREGKSQIAVSSTTAERIWEAKASTGQSTDEILTSALDAFWKTFLTV